MKTTGILLVGYSAIDFKIAAGVAHLAFPRAVVKSAKTVEEAMESAPLAHTDLLVLLRPTKAQVIKALEAEDRDGLPRWAVVVVDSHPAPLGAESISPEEWAGPVTPHAFRSAIAQYALRRDLARVRGDLNAIGVRITHDLRTQVASILATAELSRELLNEIEPSETELYQPIFDSVDALGKLIERISFVTKASATETAKTPLPMKEVVANAISRLNGDIAAKNATITQPTDWPEINGAKPFLEKIWFNLIANALNHSGEAPKIQLGWHKEKQAYRFWIRDQGKGVEATARDLLFHPFHLLHRKGSPRGLGLPIVQRLTELHGGQCGYKPPASGGAEFYFTLPA